MRIVLFCEQKYAISILRPIEKEAEREASHQILWYIHKKNIPQFTPESNSDWTFSIQEVYNFSPEAIFVPCNIVPYYLPGIKIQIFHTYASEKKRHWKIRNYFDAYFTQGPFFTQYFMKLAEKYKSFDVIETGWPRQDWIFENLNSFDDVKRELLKQHNKKHLILYAPTFSPSLTSLPFLKKEIVRLARDSDSLVMIKQHPLTNKKWETKYRFLAEREEHIIWIDDHQITKYELMADLLISDTSSTIYEFLLLDKPVITLCTKSSHTPWLDIKSPAKLYDAVASTLKNDSFAKAREAIRNSYDPHLDGKVAHRMLQAAKKLILENGVPTRRPINPWRKYTSLKKFGRISR